MVLKDLFRNTFAKPVFSSNASNNPSIFSFEIEDERNGKIKMEDYRGKIIVIVNSASTCGFTPQFKGLQSLSMQMKNELVVLAFPCNDFGAQEKLKNAEIKTFCSANFGVTFPVYNKVKIKGKQISPLYKWLSDAKLNGWNNQLPAWNFWKYVLNEEGKLVAVFPSRFTIDEKQIEKIRSLSVLQNG